MFRTAFSFNRGEKEDLNERSNTSRREFLKGRAAADALRSAANQSRGPSSSRLGSDHETTERQNAYLEHYSMNAMGCEFALLFNMQQFVQSGKAAAASFELVEQLENQMSIFRADSEISRLNETARQWPTRVDPQLFRLLRLAAGLFNETGGAFDITSTPLTKVWGFDQRNGSIPPQTSIDSALSLVGCEQIVFDDSSNTIFFDNERTVINLGGIGKGYTLDRMTDLILDRAVFDFLIHGGQSSVVARGSQLLRDEGNDSDEMATMEGWTVGLSHPLLPDRRIAEISLKNEALGTSGTGRQGFFCHGKRYGHIIDPRTGWPSDHFLSTTVISPSAALSDALATAFFVMSIEEVEAYCLEHPDVKAILVSEGEKPGRTQLDGFNLDQADWLRL